MFTGIVGARVAFTGADHREYTGTVVKRTRKGNFHVDVDAAHGHAAQTLRMSPLDMHESFPLGPQDLGAYLRTLPVGEQIALPTGVRMHRTGLNGGRVVVTHPEDGTRIVDRFVFDGIVGLVES